MSAASELKAVLSELRAQYPRMKVTRETWVKTSVWVARGPNGHPWILASDDLQRFRKALAGQ